MFGIIVVVLAAAVVVGYILLRKNMKKKAKNCKCGHAYTIDNVVSYRGEKKGTLMGGVQTSYVYVTLECPKCRVTQEKCIEVSYNVNLNETLKDGIRRFF